MTPADPVVTKLIASLEEHDDPVWTYADFQTRSDKDYPETPSHWPEGWIPMEGRWATWLPPDWGHAKHFLGEKHPGYVSPDGTIVDKKYKVEKRLNKTLVEPTDVAPSSYK